MQKYDIGNKKPQLKIGEKVGCLTVISKPYYIIPKGDGHRRQFFDCKCDCGNVKTKIKGSYLKRQAGVLLFCNRECPFYFETLKHSVPEEDKKCRLGEVYNYLTVTKEAFYFQEKGTTNRCKYIEVKCKCGKIKKYRESKVYNGSYKSCGCVWEHKDKFRDWKAIERNYGITESDYNDFLKKQNNVCAICKESAEKIKKSEYLFVDHCHDSNKVRGLLCDTCNNGIGLFKDDVELLENAINYLNCKG